MIIDDNQIDRYITSRIVKKNNFGRIVIEFSAAADALKYLVENKDHTDKLPEIIFVDIYMPMMSGFEFMEVYSGLSDSLKIKPMAFIISSTIDVNDISKVEMNPNIVDFQQKPVAREFLDSIAAKLET